MNYETLEKLKYKYGKWKVQLGRDEEKYFPSDLEYGISKDYSNCIYSIYRWKQILEHAERNYSDEYIDEALSNLKLSIRVLENLEKNKCLYSKGTLDQLYIDYTWPGKSLCDRLSVIEILLKKDKNNELIKEIFYEIKRDKHELKIQIDQLKTSYEEKISALTSSFSNKIELLNSEFRTALECHSSSESKKSWDSHIKELE
jgi:hypothetical protein